MGVEWLLKSVNITGVNDGSASKGEKSVLRGTIPLDRGQSR